eukprot:scaffold1523_cov140-Isochrysis_galbana.AAC.4
MPAATRACTKRQASASPGASAAGPPPPGVAMAASRGASSSLCCVSSALAMATVALRTPASQRERATSSALAQGTSPLVETLRHTLPGYASSIRLAASSKIHKRRRGSPSPANTTLDGAPTCSPDPRRDFTADNTSSAEGSYPSGSFAKPESAGMTNDGPRVSASGSALHLLVRAT